MKKAKIFLVIGIVLLIGLPLYQTISSKEEKWGDESRIDVYGNNFLSPLIGVKKVWMFYNFEPVSTEDSGFQWSGTLIQNPKWMQFIGLQKEVAFGSSEYHGPHDFPESSIGQIVVTIILRTIIKLLLPSIFFFFAYRFNKK